MNRRVATLPVMAALGAVYFFWGTTYLGMKFAIETLPPFFMLSLRFMIAGVLLFAWTASRYKPEATPGQLRGAAFSGAVMLLGGTGLVAWAEQVVPSNVAAIVIATMPLWMALIRWVALRGDRPGKTSMAGLVLGFAGTLLLVQSSTAGAPGTEGHAAGLAVLLLAAFLWASGSLLSRTLDQPVHPGLATSVQLLSGGLCCLLAGLLTGEAGKIHLDAISLRSAAAIAYLAVFGSVVAFSCYTWLLKATDPALASSYAYVSPVVAVTAGWVLAGESLNAGSLVAAAVILISVVLIVRGTETAGRKTGGGPKKRDPEPRLEDRS
ncbi:MAG: EamA family transporter [Synergistales bacterium]